MSSYQIISQTGWTFLVSFIWKQFKDGEKNYISRAEYVWSNKVYIFWVYLIHSEETIRMPQYLWAIIKQYVLNNTPGLA